MRFWSRFRPLVPLVVLWATTSIVSPHALSAPQANCTGDINGDGVVNGVDLAQVLATWGPCPQYAPLVSSVSPNQGLPSGGTTITIRGQHLGRTSQVLIGGVPATGLAILDDQTVRAVTPAGVLGVRDLSLSTPAGSTVFGAAFTYTTMPWAEVLEVAPNPAVVPDASLRLAIFQTGLPWRVRDVGTGIEMLLIPPGTFMMGASPGDAEAYAQESPLHQVTLTSAFYLGRTEVTQGQWTNVMSFNHSRFPGEATRPVEDIVWNAAVDFCDRTGLRLPTEAEWEWACRAGTTTARYGPLQDIAWYNANVGPNGPRIVAQKLPNGFGLYDMIGNVWEFVSDWGALYPAGAAVNPTGPSSGVWRVFRGGSYVDGAAYMRSSMRLHLSPMCSVGNCGFRVARNP
jgi:formylglycine-generating enzyme required for sulfatase activity